LDIWTIAESMSELFLDAAFKKEFDKLMETSELLSAAKNKEWDKFMVRRLQEAVWYLQRM
jgi:hypothetical protein